VSYEKKLRFDLRDGVTLLCPACQGDYLHHDNIATYARGEDADETTVVTTCPHRGTSNIALTSGASNPSSRRNGMAVRFYCELCSVISELTLAQHKGQTLLEWRSAGEKTSDPHG
jgi:hypothetical protein